VREASRLSRYACSLSTSPGLPWLAGPGTAAISSDLGTAVVMRPVGAAVHLHKGTVNLRLVGLLSLGSVPMEGLTVR
jgi:uncharacterized membrane protein YfcA